MGGADRNPPWYHNVVAYPAVRWEIDGETHVGVASVLPGARRDDVYEKISTETEVFRAYRERTDRIIPVIEQRVG